MSTGDQTTNLKARIHEVAKRIGRKQCLWILLLTCIVLVVFIGGDTDLKISNNIAKPLKTGNSPRTYTTSPYRASTLSMTDSPGMSVEVSHTQKTPLPTTGKDLNQNITYTLSKPGKSNSNVHEDRQVVINNTEYEILNNSNNSTSSTESFVIEQKMEVSKDQNKTSNQTLDSKEDKIITVQPTINNQTAKDSKKNSTIGKKEEIEFFRTFEMNIVINEQSHEPYCAMESNWHKYLLWPDSPSDLSDWDHKRRRKCPKFIISDKLHNTRRLKYSLSCSSGRPMLLPSVTNSSSDVDVVTLNSSCLAAFTNSCCNTDGRVPNVVHYVWYFKKEMMFQTFLSIISVVRFVRPCLIIFHGEFLPYGVYWDYIIRLFPNILHVKTERPLFIYGRKISHHEHSGDVMRIEALMQLGGIYLDTDVIVLRDLKPLRFFNITMCRQSGGQFLLNSFIMAMKNATFLTHWQEGYKKDYRNNSYVYNSMQYSNDLARSRPDLIHIEVGTMCCPDILVGVNLQSSMIYDWSKLYGFHIYSRQINFPWDVNLIRNFNTTFGAMLRHVIYGNKELCL